MTRSSIAIACLVLFGAPAAGQDRAPAVDDSWLPVFNGRDLAGWTPLRPEFFAVEEEAIHVRFPAGANWGKGLGKDGNAFLESARSYHHFAVHVEVKMDHGMFGIGQWGTLKQYFDSAYIGPRWRTVVMVFRSGAGDVRLYVDGYRQVFSGTPDRGSNTNPLLFLFRQDSELWLRNIRVKTLAPDDALPGTPDPAANGTGDGSEPRELTLIPGFEREWEHEGSWSVQNAILSGTSGRARIWARTTLRTPDAGRLTFSYRGLGSARGFALLFDLPNRGLSGASADIPLPTSEWRAVELRLDGRNWVLSIDGKEVKKGGRKGDGGGIGFTLADGACTEVRDLRFTAEE